MVAQSQREASGQAAHSQIPDPGGGQQAGLMLIARGGLAGRAAQRSEGGLAGSSGLGDLRGAGRQG